MNRPDSMSPDIEEDQTITWQERIVADADVLAGKPVVRGTRLAVEFIIDLMAQGWSEADILTNYPRLSTEDIRACLHYASDVLRSEKVFPIGAAYHNPQEKEGWSATYRAMAADSEDWSDLDATVADGPD